MLSLTAEIIDRPTWIEIATTELDSDDRQTFWRADQAARMLRIDTFYRHLKAIVADPLDGTWFQAWQLAGSEGRATVLAQRAADLLDLNAIATRPSTAIGLGPDFKPHAALG